MRKEPIKLLHVYHLSARAKNTE